MRIFYKFESGYWIETRMIDLLEWDLIRIEDDGEMRCGCWLVSSLPFRNIHDGILTIHVRE